MIQVIKRVVIVWMLTASVSPVMAGLRNSVPVNVYADAYVANATGSLGTASNSADKNQYIGCTIVAVPGTAMSAICDATDAQGQYVRCKTTDPTHIAMIKSLHTDSFLFFERSQESTETCTGIQVQNRSWLEPKGQWSTLTGGN